MSDENEKKIINSQKNIELAYSLSQRKIDSQNTCHNSLESKIGILFGFVGTLSASIILLLQGKIEILGINIFTLGIISLYVTLLFLVFSSHTRTFLDPPDFSTFYSEGCADIENEKLINQIVADTKHCFDFNNTIQTYKATMYNRAVLCFAGSIFLLFLGIIEK